MSIFRVYSPEECGKDGYPFAWHATIKHTVREAAGHRCVRCGHPYAKGDGEWSACDAGCSHRGPIRVEDIGPVDDSPPMLWLRDGLVVEAAWRILTVHHLDQDKANCRWWNLVSLCQRCHLRVQRVVLMERVWPWEHSEWFRPYIAGYYAHVYLGEDISRVEAEERLGELLALERAA